MGQHAGERLRDGGARRLLPQVRERGSVVRRRRHARRRGARARAVPRTEHGSDQRRTCRWRRCSRRRSRDDAAADVCKARGAARSSTRRASATPPIGCSRTAWTPASGSQRSYAPYVENGCTAGGDELQGRRSDPRHADVRPDEGAALRRGDGSAARRLRAGRVVVRDDGRDAGRAAGRSGRRRPTTGQPGGSAAASITSSATTTASSSSRRGSSEGRHEFSYIVRATTAGHIPDRAGARGGDVRAGGLRAHGDERDRGEEVGRTVMRDVGRGLSRPPTSADTYVDYSNDLPRRSSPSVSLRRCYGGIHRGRHRDVGPARSDPCGASRRQRAASTVVVDRQGVPLYEALSGDGTRSIRLEADRLPPMLAAATVAAEDRRFYTPHRRRPDCDPSRA